MTKETKINNISIQFEKENYMYIINIKNNKIIIKEIVHGNRTRKITFIVLDTDIKITKRIYTNNKLEKTINDLEKENTLNRIINQIKDNSFIKDLTNENSICYNELLDKNCKRKLLK